jgi:hypothetical protein
MHRGLCFCETYASKTFHETDRETISCRRDISLQKNTNPCASRHRTTIGSSLLKHSSWLLRYCTCCAVLCRPSVQAKPTVLQAVRVPAQAVQHPPPQQDNMAVQALQQLAQEQYSPHDHMSSTRYCRLNQSRCNHAPAKQEALSQQQASQDLILMLRRSVQMGASLQQTAVMCQQVTLDPSHMSVLLLVLLLWVPPVQAVHPYPSAPRGSHFHPQRLHFHRQVTLPLTPCSQSARDNINLPQARLQVQRANKVVVLVGCY